MNSEERPRGLILHRLDREALTKSALGHLAVIDPDAEWLDARPDYDYVVAETFDGELYVICSEGVGWEVSYGKPFILEVATTWKQDGETQRSFVATTPVYLHPHEVKRAKSPETVDLADFVRSFGARLESNFWLWHRTLNGKVKDDSVLRHEVVGHRSTRKLAQKYIDSYADAIGETTSWNGSESVPVNIVWTIEPAGTGKGFDIVSTVYRRDEEKEVQQ